MRPGVRTGDCIDVMNRGAIQAKSIRLIFADPPYNIGIDYGESFDDSRTDQSYSDWSNSWMNAAHRLLTPDGSLWLLINHEWAWRLMGEAKQIGFHLRQWITWYESFGQNQKRKFNRCSRALLHLTKNPTDFVFRADDSIVRTESYRLKHGDKRANPNGKLYDDVWTIPRLCGSHKERLKAFPTQLPLELVRRVVAVASDPGDWVLDPFSGSGTTGCVCKELGRNFIGIELFGYFAEQSQNRINAHDFQGNAIVDEDNACG